MLAPSAAAAGMTNASDSAVPCSADGVRETMVRRIGSFFSASISGRIGDELATRDGDNDAQAENWTNQKNSLYRSELNDISTRREKKTVVKVSCVKTLSCLR